MAALIQLISMVSLTILTSNTILTSLGNARFFILIKSDTLYHSESKHDQPDNIEKFAQSDDPCILSESNYINYVKFCKMAAFKNLILAVVYIFNRQVEVIWIS